MKPLKIGGVVLGALFVTTLGISASDMLQGASGSLLAQLGASDNRPCPVGMVHVPTGGTFACIDEFEAVPSAACPHQTPRSNPETQANLADPDCSSTSQPAGTPWVFVAREQARALCARAGKRLPTAAEWYHAAVATPNDETCNINSTALVPGSADTTCRSAVGVANMVGNAWEWIDGDVIDAQYGSRTLPTAGYVAQVTSDGLASRTSSTPVAQFNGDYFWSEAEGGYGLLRGGYYDSATDAGVYATQAEAQPTLATAAIGFRCVQ